MKHVWFWLLGLLLFVPAGAQAASMMEVSYWEARAGSVGDSEVASRSEIAAMNEAIRNKDEMSVDLAAYPTEVAGETVLSYIKEMAPSVTGLSVKDETGHVQSVTAEERESLMATAVSPKLQSAVRFAVTTTRTNLRCLPTESAWFDAKSARQEDRLQGTAADPAEAVAVLADSADGKWCFVQMRNYRGWVLKSTLAFTDDLDTWLSYVEPDRFLVVTANIAAVTTGQKKVDVKAGKTEKDAEDETAEEPAALSDFETYGKTDEDSYLKELRMKAAEEKAEKEALEAKAVEYEEVKEIFQMGSRIPLAGHAWQTWKVRIPAANAQGRLVERIVKVPHDVKMFHEGYIPYTTNNIVRQAFRFIGDVYGWGGLENSIDSSALAADIYRTVGIELPRDSVHQEAAMPHRIELPELLTDAEREPIIGTAMPGSLLFQPGQVSILLGTTTEGKPMVLQALYSYGTEGPEGAEVQYPCRVLLSSLSLMGPDGRSFAKRITSVGTLIP